MADFYKLNGQIKHYEWGSKDFIPRFLGLENREGQPWAELWMGTHPGAPSVVEVNGSAVNLADFIAESTGYCLGEGARQFGELPFLFKLLAAGKPLSIQAHPNQRQAREGFERENRAGLALDDPGRNYKDPNHKPEIICALVPLTLMAGFREPAEIFSLLEAFLAAAPSSLREAFAPLLAALEQGGSLQKFFGALFDLSVSQREELSRYILEAGPSATGAGKTAPSPDQWKHMLCFAGLYPADPAVIAPLYLNLLVLEPGQAIFVRAGILHAYIDGFGVELMANSDNVLRGGLTPKHIDIPQLMNVLDFSPFMPQVLKAPPFSSDSSGAFCYPAPCEEFSLSVMRGRNDEKAFPIEGPAVCIVTGGELRITGGEAAGTGGAVIKKGEAFFVPAGGNDTCPLVFCGDYQLYAAGPGTP